MRRDATGLPVRGQGAARGEHPGPVRGPGDGRPLADGDAARSSGHSWAPCCSASPGRSSATTRLARGLLAPGRGRSRWCVEAQHPSWDVDETFAALRAAGAVLCTTDLDDLPRPPGHPANRAVPVPAPAAHHLRRCGARRLGARLAPFLDDGLDAYVLFRHDEDGASALLAEAFAERVERVLRADDRPPGARPPRRLARGRRISGRPPVSTIRDPARGHPAGGRACWSARLRSRSRQARGSRPPLAAQPTSGDSRRPRLPPPSSSSTTGGPRRPARPPGPRRRPRRRGARGDGFTSRCSSQPPAMGPDACSSSSRAAASASCVAARSPLPLPRHLGPGPAGGERGLLGLAFPPGFGPDRTARLVHYTGAQATRSASSASCRQPRRGGPGLRAHHPDRHPAVRQPQRRLDRVRPGGMLLIALGDGGSGGDPENRASSLATCWARCCASTCWAHRRLALRDPGRQPVRGRRRPAGDPRLRAAQPVPRQRGRGDRRPVDR